VTDPKETTVPDIDWERVRKGVEREHGTMIWRPYGVPTMLSPGGSSYFDAELSPRWDVPERLIVSAALTGAFFTREQNPNQPITPAEIVDQGRRCIEAGASTLHVHVRDGRGYNALSADLFAEVVVPLKQEYPDLMVDGCLVPSLEGEWDEMLRVLDSGLLDASPVNVTATYVGESLFAKPVPVILQKTRELLERGVKPEIATYADADVNNAERWLFRSGLLEPGACWVVLAALPGCSPMGNPRQMVEGLLRLTSAIRDVDPEAVIVVPAAGRASMWLATAAAALGLHIRVGMEDTIWMWPHRDDLVPDNPTMVRLAVQLAGVLGREVATPAEYRELLGVERHEPVRA